MILQKKKFSIFLRRAFALSILVPFVCLSIGPVGVVQNANAQTILNLPEPGTMVPLSQPYTPATIIGMTVHPDDPFLFDFIVNPGDANLKGDELSSESNKLIKYFMAALTVPEDEMWVNLSPYEKDRIIPKGFGDTEMGRDLLAQDYMLKQLTASLMYPEDELGNDFWNRVYKKAQEKYGVTEVPMNTFNKVWIVPDKAVIYENGTSAFIVESHLKVMLEEDYLALESNAGNDKHGLGSIKKEDLTKISEVHSEIIREVIIPEIEKEVNEGKTFANLRQISNSVILATWYKQNVQGSILEKIYINKNRTGGIDIVDKEINQKIYDQYIEAFKKGVYDFIREDYDETTQEVVPRKYFSGGVKENWQGKIESGDQSMLGKLESVQAVTARISSSSITNFPQNIKKINLVFYGNIEEIHGSEDIATLLQAARVIRKRAPADSEIEIIVSSWSFPALKGLLGVSDVFGDSIYVEKEGLTISIESSKMAYSHETYPEADLVITFNESRFRKHPGKLQIVLGEIELTPRNSYSRVVLDEKTFFVPAGVGEEFSGLYLDEELNEIVNEYDDWDGEKRYSERKRFLANILDPEFEWDGENIGEMANWDWTAAYQSSLATLATLRVLYAARKLNSDFAKKDIIFFTFASGNNDLTSLMRGTYELGFEYLDFKNKIFSSLRSPDKVELPVLEYGREKSEAAIKGFYTLHGNMNGARKYINEFSEKYQPEMQPDYGKVWVINLGYVANEDMVKAFLYSNLPVAVEGAVTPTKVIQMRKPYLMAFPSHLREMQRSFQQTVFDSLGESEIYSEDAGFIAHSIFDYEHKTLDYGRPGSIDKDSDLARYSKIFVEYEKYAHLYNLINNALIAKGNAMNEMLNQINRHWKNDNSVFSPDSIRKLNDNTAATLSSKNGGIDMNPQNIDMQTHGDDTKIRFPVFNQNLQFNPGDGFAPVIINIAPATNISELIGLRLESKEMELMAKEEILN